MEQQVDRFLHQQRVMANLNPHASREQTAQAAMWWRLHQQKTHAKYCKERMPIQSLRAHEGYLTGRPMPSFAQPSLPSPGRSPRARPQSARAVLNGGLKGGRGLSSYPPFKPYDPEIAQMKKKKNFWEEDDFKAQFTQTDETMAIVDTGPKRKWGDLPAGVTPDMVRKAASAMKEKFIDKFGTLTKAFRAMDEDASGTVTREELDRYLLILNLNSVAHPDVITALFETIDADESGNFDFREFSRVMSSGDVMNMAKIEDKVDGYQKVLDEQIAQERAAKEYEAKQLGLTVEEYEDYYGDWKQATSADMAHKARDRWGKVIRGEVLNYAV